MANLHSYEVTGPKRKEPELDPKEQAKRFQETAKDADVDVKVAEMAFENLTRSASKYPQDHEPHSKDEA